MKTRMACVLLFFQTSLFAATPEWIWTDREQRQARFTRNLEINHELRQATLKIMTDFCTADVQCNGRNVVRLEAFDSDVSVSPASFLQRGKNTIAIEATSREGPAAIAVQIDLLYVDGRSERWVSNGDWPGTTSYGRMQSVPWTDPETKPSVSDFSEYNQWREALGNKQGPDQATFALHPDFEIKRLRSAQPGEDSWVSMVFDDRRRIIIGKE
ncbi:MAG: hypothetical protein AAF492_06065, partial [Verrucomicrobiota bacterium]